ncbi:unnamed protein product [Adineta ricciae]|uniref:Rad50/SbcC-type AAA domain-containing protein n=2 Tax=Adineta ricciae TaxID=249248 RepID=A0A815QAP5_ADIRI|nr:unnamed protein product [Adineta ricciae]
MANNTKRPFQSTSDLNNNQIVSPMSSTVKKKKTADTTKEKQSYTIGQIKELQMLNFMCHKNFSMKFHPTPMQIVTGANGSGKSTIANAICLCLGAQARTTGRTANVQSFIRKGETSAELTITLANEGAEAYKPELYGKEIQIVRRISAARSFYKILGEHRKIIGSGKETVAEIIQALSISPENPLCVLHQEIAKTFLLNSDARKKYQFYMKVSQLDQIKQAYEEAVCTVQSISQRINKMKEKHVDMLRAMEPLDQQVKKIEIRRDQEENKHKLEAELIVARGNEAQKELSTIKNELDQTQKSKDETEKRLTEIMNRMNDLDRRIKEFSRDKEDVEKDLSSPNGLRELNYQFSKEKKEIELLIYRLSRDCEKCYQSLTEIEEEQKRLKKHMDEHQNLSQESNQSDRERLQVENEIQTRENQQLQWNKAMTTYTDEINAKNETIRTKKSTLDLIQNELRQKKQELDELEKLEKDRASAYGAWMPDCLKAIQNDNRFKKKPIGPIGRYIRCTEPRWAYAVEKHLASVMSAFICSEYHDERILLELFTTYASGYRPVIFTMKYRDRTPDISGTLERISRANLLSFYQVLKIENVVVECALIDLKQIEATILIENLEAAKQLRRTGALLWESVNNKVKRVVEAWTCDGSNVKLDKAFRIYTNDRQPLRYFSSNTTQSLSNEELNKEIRDLQEQVNQTNVSIDDLKAQRQRAVSELETIKKSSVENQKKLKELTKELDRINSVMPITYDFTTEELEEKMNECNLAYTSTKAKFDEAIKAKESKHQDLADITQKYENIMKKVESKTKEIVDIDERIVEEQSKYHDMNQQISRLTKKSSQLDEDIEKYEERIADLSKKLPKKSKALKSTNRSVREIQLELDGINHFLKSNEDTQEQRRQVIEEFKTKRDAASTFKKLCDRCQAQLKHLETFVNKRKERFGRIADQHQFLLRRKFEDLMQKHHFNDCDIKIDHKREELEIIINKNQRRVASLSGGERSISTFCFLVALWGSIYQPFRLLDEIDIYMDNEKRNSSLELLYDNTRYYSSSQHVMFTPQAIDPQVWKAREVPIFCMPTPKRSLE